MRRIWIGLVCAILVLATAVSADASIIAGWDFNSLPGGTNDFGPSPFAAATADANVAVGGLTRGSGVGTTGTAAARAWGGDDWTSSDAAAAIAAGEFATFTVQANAGFKLSLSSIDPFDYRRSSSGPANGLVQYSIGGAFTDIASVSYSSSSSSGASLSPIDLSGIADLQNLAASTLVTFRIVNWGATSGAGTWYLFDKGNSTASDFAVNGSTAIAVPEPSTVAIFLVLSGLASVVAARRR